MTNKERANYALVMARRYIDSGEGWWDALRFVENAINTAVEEEREACAKIVDNAHWHSAQELAAAIRARCDNGGTK